MCESYNGLVIHMYSDKLISFPQTIILKSNSKKIMQNKIMVTIGKEELPRI